MKTAPVASLLVLSLASLVASLHCSSGSPARPSGALAGEAGMSSAGSSAASGSAGDAQGGAGGGSGEAGAGGQGAGLGGTGEQGGASGGEQGGAGSAGEPEAGGFGGLSQLSFGPLISAEWQDDSIVNCRGLDLDGDKRDEILCNFSIHRDKTLLAIEDGKVVVRGKLPFEYDMIQDVADLDGDGDLDFSVTFYDEAGLHTRLIKNNGGGSFSLWQEFPPVGVLDMIRRKGKPYLVLRGKELQGYKLEGDVFKPVGSKKPGFDKDDARKADFDGDGEEELLYPATKTAARIVIPDDEGLTMKTIYSPGESLPFSSFFLLGDVDGDKKAEMIAHLTESGVLAKSYLLKLEGDKMVQSGWSMPFVSFLMVDYNQDGLVDLLASKSENPYFVRIFLGNGGGDFQEYKEKFSINLGSLSFIGDFDGNGLPDVCSYRQGLPLPPSRVSVSLNLSQ